MSTAIDLHPVAYVSRTSYPFPTAHNDVGVSVLVHPDMSTDDIRRSLRKVLARIEATFGDARAEYERVWPTKRLEYREGRSVRDLNDAKMVRALYNATGKSTPGFGELLRRHRELEGE